PWPKPYSPLPTDPRDDGPAHRGVVAERAVDSQLQQPAEEARHVAGGARVVGAVRVAEPVVGGELGVLVAYGPHVHLEPRAVGVADEAGRLAGPAVRADGQHAPGVDADPAGVPGDLLQPRRGDQVVVGEPVAGPVPAR